MYFILVSAVLGLCCCAWAFSSCGTQASHVAAPNVAASLVAELRL